jgi:hypothetical protein
MVALQAAKPDREQQRANTYSHYSLFVITIEFFSYA